jgi:hypothetical protein
VAAAFCLAVLGGILLPHSGGLPKPALGTRWLLYALRALLIFYGLLLLLIPLIRALRGELPVELSMRGARYEEAGATSTALEELTERVRQLEVQLREIGELTAESIERLAALEDSGGEAERAPE